MADNLTVDRIDSQGSSSVDAYLEYKRIVRDDDNGNLFSDSEYERYKKTVVVEVIKLGVLKRRMKNRLYVSWTNGDTKMECKQIGPECKCICKHRFHQHKTDFKVPSNHKGEILLPCEDSNCRCSNYTYVPSFKMRCRCKHLQDEHDIKGKHTCSYPRCECKQLQMTFTCACGEAAYKHFLNVETMKQRQAAAKPIGKDTPYKAMGGITGFSSLADGMLRLDVTGVGVPSDEFLSQPIKLSDHPILKCVKENEGTLQRRNEDDMDYYERRYKERLKEEKMRARGIKK